MPEPSIATTGVAYPQAIRDKPSGVLLPQGRVYVLSSAPESLRSVSEFVEILARGDVPLQRLCRFRNPNGMQPARPAIWSVSQAFGAVRIAGSVCHR